VIVNADREFESGRAQNYLRAEHAEKIITAYHGWQTIDGFCRPVSLDEIRAKDNEYNLNIRRYVDNSPPPEPQDVRAHLSGGVPRVEVMAQKELFDTHGLDTRRIFSVRDQDYYTFSEKITGRAQIPDVVKTSPTVQQQEQAILDAFRDWWTRIAASRLDRLQNKNNVMKIRADFITSFDTALEPIGMLDHFKRVGVLVTWWDQCKEDFKTVAVAGFEELIDGWADFIRDMIDDTESRKQEKFDPFEHKLVKKLLPDYLREIENTKAEISRLEGEIETFEAGPEDEELGDLGEDEEHISYAKQLETEIKELKANKAGKAEIEAVEAKLAPWKKLKKELTEARRKLKALGKALIVRLEVARKGLSAKDCRELVLSLARDDLEAILRKYMDEHFQEIAGMLNSLEFEKGRFFLSHTLAPKGKEIFMQWYCGQAVEWIKRRVNALKDRVAAEPESVGIRDLGFRWGSCTHKGKMFFHWRIILLPPERIDYLILHELVHIHEHNHSPAFYERLRRASPDYKQHEDWLRRYGDLYSL
jgi:type I restriction enzyme M protein